MAMKPAVVVSRVELAEEEEKEEEVEESRSEDKEQERSSPESRHCGHSSLAQSLQGTFQPRTSARLATASISSW